MNEDKATRYHRLRRRAQVLSLVSAGLVLAAVTAAGGASLRTVSGTVARMASERSDVQWWLSVVVSAVLLAVLLDLAALPASHYLGSVLERRYGMSRQQPLEWWRDHVKAMLLATALAVVLALSVYAAIAWIPVAWWLVAGVWLALLAALLAAGAPVAIFPLFYRFRRLPSGELADRLTALAVRAGAPVLGVYEWALGDKSRTANAALVGLGPTRRILLSDTLLAEYTTDEIEVVIAHELAHHVHGDIWRGVAFEALQGTLSLLGGHLALVTCGPALGVTSLADVAGMPLVALAAGACSVVTSPLVLAASRRHERCADRFALELTEKPDAFVSVMRRLGTQNLADHEPSRLIEWLFHSHPSLNARIAFARRWAVEHPSPALPG